MKALKAKMKSRAGETIAEVLIALLISALALMMLASLISSSGNMVTQSSETMKKYYGTWTKENNPSSVSVKYSESNECTLPAQYYSAYIGGISVAYYIPSTTGG